MSTTMIVATTMILTILNETEVCTREILGIGHRPLSVSMKQTNSMGVATTLVPMVGRGTTTHTILITYLMLDMAGTDLVMAMTTITIWEAVTLLSMVHLHHFVMSMACHLELRTMTLTIPTGTTTMLTMPSTPAGRMNRDTGDITLLLAVGVLMAASTPRILCTTITNLLTDTIPIYNIPSLVMTATPIHVNSQRPTILTKISTPRKLLLSVDRRTTLR